MSGHVGSLSVKQEQTLQEFRKAIGDLLNEERDDDYYLLRWLRARDFNAGKAEQMIREHIVWREHYDTDNILDGPESPLVLRKYYPGGLIGPDRDGCPVWIIPFGISDLKGILMSVTRGEMMKHVIRSFEVGETYMKKQSKLLGRTIETQIFVFDFDGFSLRSIASKAVLDFITDLMSLFENNYPERLKAAYVVNAPRIFPMFWKIIRPFICENTAKKVRIFGRDGWKEILLDMVGADVLPAHWGGTRTDPDGNPRCPSVVLGGYEVPSFYYRTSRPQEGSEGDSDDSSNDSGSRMCIVDRQSSLEVPVEVSQSGSLLSWEFQSEQDKDVGFGVYYHGGTLPGDSLKELLKPSRVICRGAPETGALTCSQPGVYVLKFDNSFSWFTQKKVSYSVRVTPPTECVA
ncbi:SEC14-like protein 2 [Ornithodoros turicata]|uniref:SEC14-like protein 2 n=1 Tax=Ornithodoros turicata TaxID=34597 RepID=UPI00313879FB